MEKVVELYNCFKRTSDVCYVTIEISVRVVFSPYVHVNFLVQNNLLQRRMQNCVSKTEW